MHTPHLSIITGSSRGLGLGLAAALLQRGGHVIGIARQPNAALQASAPGRLYQWAMDLSDGAAVAAQLQQWLQAQDSAQYASATLINNAAILPRLAPLSDCAAPPQWDDLTRALRVGLEAPMLLSAAFLSATEGWRAERKILNISSGLGRRPMAAQSGYCAVKAGLDHFTRCLALDEAVKPQGAKVCALAPGVIDTDMQTQLRSADAALFSSAPLFAQLHEQAMLTPVDACAQQVLAWLERPDFGNPPVADVRDA